MHLPNTASKSSQDIFALIIAEQSDLVFFEAVVSPRGVKHYPRM